MTRSLTRLLPALLTVVPRRHCPNRKFLPSAQSMRKLFSRQVSFSFEERTATAYFLSTISIDFKDSRTIFGIEALVRTSLFLSAHL